MPKNRTSLTRPKTGAAGSARLVALLRLVYSEGCKEAGLLRQCGNVVLKAEGAGASKSQSFPAVWLQVLLLGTHAVSESQLGADDSTPGSDSRPQCQQTIHWTAYRHSRQQR